MREEDYRKALVPPLDQEGFSRFLKALDEDPVKGCSLNPRVSSETVLNLIQNSSLDLVFTGFIRYPYGTFVGKLPLYLSGGIYPMDRSAYAVSYALAKALSGVEAPRVLDMCAAPGGKSIALSNLLKLGFLWCNDISRKRAGILRTNIERAGVENSCVTSLDPLKLPSLGFKGAFDAVILDAPCSGSGMTRKDSRLDEDWSIEKVQECVRLQKPLIEAAAELVSDGGYISYSTCSYSREEDEDIIEEFLNNHPEFKLVDTEDDGSIPGIGEIGRRYVPGLFEGEGQYRCILKKSGELKPHEKFAGTQIEVAGKTFTGIRVGGVDRILGDCVSGIERVPVLKLGYAVENSDPDSKFEYDWDLSHLSGLPFPDVELSSDKALTYLSGQDIRGEESKGEPGIVRLTYLGLALGFGKRMQGRIRNLLPKGLRIRL